MSPVVPEGETTPGGDSYDDHEGLRCILAYLATPTCSTASTRSSYAYLLAPPLRADRRVVLLKSS